MRVLAAALMLVAGAAQAGESCPTPALCKPLEAAMVRCQNDAHDCSEFLTLMKRVAPKYDCSQLHSETGEVISAGPMAAIHRCDYQLESDAFTLLGSLKTPEAISYFCSDLYASTLGADLSETMHQRGLDTNPHSVAYYEKLTDCSKDYGLSD